MKSGLDLQTPRRPIKKPNVPPKAAEAEKELISQLKITEDDKNLQVNSTLDLRTFYAHQKTLYIRGLEIRTCSELDKTQDFV